MKIENKKIKILSTGAYLPKKISSEEIEKKYNLERGWSEKFSGVANRHHATFESNAYMGAKAIESALEKANLTLADIDLIISAGATFDYPLPNQASVTKSKLSDGKKYNVPSIDVDTSCLSFVTSFDIASKMIDNYQYKKVVIVTTELGSKGLNPKNPETLTLFGDAAVAMIISFDEKSDSCYIKGAMNTFSDGLEHAIIKGGGNEFFFKDNPYDPALHSFKMDGRNLLKIARKEIGVFTETFFSDIDYDINEMKIVIPHQASKTGIALFKKIFNFKEGIVKDNLTNHGNCIAASIPLVIHQLIESGQMNRGDLCFLLGTSAGFSVGATLFRY